MLATRADSRFLSPRPWWIVGGGIFLSLIWLGFAVTGKRLFTKRWEGYLRRYESNILAQQGFAEDLRMFTDVESVERSLC